MSQRGPGAGEIIAGIFLILFGLCVTLVGGGCTFLMVTVVIQGPDSGGVGFLFISLAVLAVGLAAIWGGIRLMSPRR